MRRSLVLLLVVALVAGALAGPATAGKKKKKKKKPVKVERVVEFDYTCPCGVFQLGSATGENIGGGPIGPAGVDEKYLSGVATDLTGNPVLVSVQGDTDGDGFNNAIAEFCGETTEPLEVPSGINLIIFIRPGPCSAGVSTPTQGHVTFTFANLP